MFVAASQKKRKIWKRWTRFEEGQCDTIAGWWDTLHEIVEERAMARGKTKDGGRGYNK